MTKRASYREVIPRCQAITQKKVRCTRDATCQHDGKAYCDRHHATIINAKLKLYGASYQVPEEIQKEWGLK